MSQCHVYITENVVGTATPKEEESRGRKASWHLSTGDELTIQSESSSSSSLGLTFHLENKNFPEPSVREKKFLLSSLPFLYSFSEILLDYCVVIVDELEIGI